MDLEEGTAFAPPLEALDNFTHHMEGGYFLVLF